jgi:hypothetical protein
LGWKSETSTAQFLFANRPKKTFPRRRNCCVRIFQTTSKNALETLAVRAWQSKPSTQSHQHFCRKGFGQTYIDYIVDQIPWWAQMKTPTWLANSSKEGCFANVVAANEGHCSWMPPGIPLGEVVLQMACFRWGVLTALLILWMWQLANIRACLLCLSCCMGDFETAPRHCIHFRREI